MKTAQNPTCRNLRGFTLLELVAVIAIVAILSISATAMFNRQAFDTARFARELEAVLAYAQKSAVAQRRTVNVSLASTTVSFTICLANPCAGTTPLPLPTQAGGSSLAVPNGVALTATFAGAAQALPANFAFDPLGAASPGPVGLTATGDIVKLVQVERDTGYVH